MGIPADLTERIIPVTRMQNTVYETDDQMGYVSLPALFRLENKDAPHGLILKPVGSLSGQIKTVLLTPRIDKDIEIPETNIHELPKAFSGLFRYFRGGCFDGQTVVLMLDPEKLIEGIR